MPYSFEQRLSIGVLPFTGRETELQQLSSAYHDAYNGARVVVWLAGEMGSGKSRLLDEFCHGGTLDRSLLVWLRAHKDDAANGSAALGISLIEALEARPSLRRQIESALEIPLPSYYTTTMLGRVFDVLARRVPLVIAIDDIDAAGEAFAAELGGVLQNVEGPFLVIATTSPGFGEKMAGVARTCEAEAVGVAVEPLGPHMLARQVEDLLGIELSDDDAVWLFGVTHGLPILLREALHALIRGGCLVRREDEWELSHPFSECHFSALEALPMLRARLAELPEEERKVLAALALIGRRIPHTVVAMLGFDEGWHQPLIARDLLIRSPRMVEFPHELVFEGAFAEAQRMALHERFRQPLIRLIASSAIPGAGFHLPHQTLRALTEGGTTEERGIILDTLFDAAYALAQQEEWSAAAVYCDEVYHWWSEAQRSHDELRIAQWIESYSIVLYRQGRIREQQGVLHEFLARFEPATLPTALIPSVVTLLLYVVENCYRQKQIDAALGLLDRASEILHRGAEEDIGRLSTSIALYRGETLIAAERPAEAKAIFREILQTSDTSTFSPRAFDALMALSKLPQLPAEREFVTAHVRMMLELCERLDLRRPAVQLRAALVNVFYMDGDHRAAEPMIRDLIKETQRCSLPRTESNAWYWLAVISAIHGDFAESLRLLERTIEIRRRVSSIAMWQIAIITKAQFLTALRRHQEALAVLDELEENARRNGRECRRFNIEFCRALIAVREGDWQRQQARIAELRAIGEQEHFDATEQALLELEGEILLHAPVVSQSDAGDYIDRVINFKSNYFSNRMLIVMAAAVAGRGIDSGSTANKRRALPASFQEALERTLETLRYWKDGGMGHNIARALPMLRTHALHLFAIDDLTPYAEIETAVNSSIPAYEYEVVTLGRLRVLDRSGAERGARHFGTHKSDSKPRKILAALAAASVQGRRLTRERLIDMVWGEGTSNDTTSNNFHVTLSGLRQVIGDGIDFDGSTYVLNPNLLRIDAVEFLERVAEGMQADLQGKTFRAYDLLREACDLYTGEFLEGIYDEWSDAPRDMLRVKARGAYLRLAELAVQRGEHDVARNSIRRLLEMDATDEEAIHLQLSILAIEGERTRALREYERFTNLLQCEYGVSPSKRLRDLRDTIANG